MLRIDEKIKKNVKCCACGNSLEDSKFINGVALNKLATWKYPVWSNILVQDKYPESRAVAILCDKCVEERKTPRFAVEWDTEHNIITYHDIKQLKDLPQIKEEDILEAESELYDFGVSG